MKHIRPLDFVILILILLAGVFSLKRTTKVKGDVIYVHAGGNLYEFDLSENGIHEVEGLIGITTIEVQDGKVRIIDSPCPGKTCINQGWDSSIVCLPNRVIVTVEKYGEFDAIAE